ncbi:hypothetical protein DFH09DRAFT_1094542 [Mycena vulgaris]|nr:hypothetical protein DFH09DRAFT_1094542 [Mycena vulgaris]
MNVVSWRRQSRQFRIKEKFKENKEIHAQYTYITVDRSRNDGEHGKEKHEKGKEAMVFALFDTLEHNALLFYIACSDLLDVTRELSQARGARRARRRALLVVARLEADHILGPPGTFSLLYHQAPMLLCALEEPTQRHVWATLWEAVLRCDEEMAYGKWGKEHDPQERHWFHEFKDAARKIAEDESTPVLWRGRFAASNDWMNTQRIGPGSLHPSGDSVDAIRPLGPVGFLGRAGLHTNSLEKTQTTVWMEWGPEEAIAADQPCRGTARREEKRESSVEEI